MVSFSRSLGLFCALALTALAASCSRAGYETSAAKAWYQIEAITGQIVPGQAGVMLRLEMGNSGADALNVLSWQPRFVRDGMDVAAEFTVRAPALAGVALAPDSEHSVVFEVAINAQLAPGPVEIDGNLSLRDARGNIYAAIRRGSAARWQVVAWLPDGGAGADRDQDDGSAPPDAGGRDADLGVDVGPAPEAVLTVTVRDDEDDTAGAPTLEAAGGAQDLSLREALRIAASATTPYSIRFSPAVFDAQLPGVIVVDPALGALPALSLAGTWLDGRGAGVVIDGSLAGEMSGLVVTGADVAVLGLTVRGFVQSCVRVDADRFALVDSTVSACGAPAQVDLLSGQGHRLNGCIISGANGTGLSLSSATSGAVISNCEVSSSQRQGLELRGVSHQVHDCLFNFNNLYCLLTEDLTSTRLRGNHFVRNGAMSPGQGNAPTIYVKGSTSDLTLEECLVAQGYKQGMFVQSGATRIRSTRTDFLENADQAIELELGANQGVLPPTIDSFDGQRVQGGSTVEGGTIEVFSSTSTGYTYLASTQVQGGAFELSIGPPQNQVAATLTTPEGSTSAFGETVTLSRAPLLLQVTTAEDELDGGDEIFTVEQAGGAQDLSLREAIVLANAWIGPDTISFDPLVFVPGQNVSIQVGTGSAGPITLPPLTDADTTIDGVNAEVSIDGGDLLFAADTALLDLRGDRCALRALRLHSYSAPDGALVRIRDSDQNLVHGCTLQCGATLTPALWGDWLNDLVVAETEIQGCHKGVVLDRSTSVSILRCYIHDSQNVGIQATYTSMLLLSDNRLRACAGSAVNVGPAVFTFRVIGNLMWDNGVGVTLDDHVDEVELAFNTLVYNQTAVVIRLTILAHNNLIAHNSAYGFHSGTTIEHHNLFFDNGGDGVTGVNAVKDRDPSALDPSDVLADPELANVNAGDFTPGSAAVDVGVDVGQDRNGDAPGLYNGAAPDIGAVETL